jgi:hypothetical protein
MMQLVVCIILLFAFVLVALLLLFVRSILMIEYRIERLDNSRLLPR